MIQVCMDCDIIYGEKEPYEDRSYTHGLCPKCFKKRLEELEGRRELKKVGRRLINMPNGNRHPVLRPKKGDFVLAFDEIWVVQKIEKRIAYIENVASREYEKLYIGAFESTPIRTWEVE